MKLAIPRGELLAGLAKAASVVGKSTTMPILAHTLLEAGAGGLTITATDLDIAIKVAIGGKIAAPGSIAVPGRMLLDIARRLPDKGEVELEFDPAASQLQIRAGRSRFRLATLPADTFPLMKSPDAAASFEIAGGELARMFERVLPAVDKSEARFYLAGIHLHALPDKALRAVATNGHVLSLAQTELAVDVAADMPAHVIIPDKAARELKRLAEGFAGSMRISVAHGTIEALAGDTVLTSKLIDGSYPDYQRVIPTQSTCEITTELEHLRAAVDRVSIVGQGEKGSGARIRLAFDADRLTLTATDPDGGSAEEELALDFDGEPFEIAFAHRYLLAAAAALDCETVRIEFNGPGAAAVFRPLPAAPELFILMPQRA